MAEESREVTLADTWANLRKELVKQGSLTITEWSITRASTPRLARMVLRDMCLRAAADAGLRDIGLEVHVNWEKAVASFTIRSCGPPTGFCPFPADLVERIRGVSAHTTIICITPEEAYAAQYHMTELSRVLQRNVSIDWDERFYLSWGTKEPKFPALSDPSWDAPIGSE